MRLTLEEDLPRSDFSLIVGTNLWLGFWTADSIDDFSTGGYMAVYAGFGMSFSRLLAPIVSNLNALQVSEKLCSSSSSALPSCV